MGPMVIAAIVSDIEFGRFKDSKDMSRDLRSKRFQELLQQDKKMYVFIVSPKTIDYYRSRKLLNKLELKILRLIRSMSKMPIVADFPENLGKFDGMIVKPGMDKSCLCTSEASVIAKVLRDSLIRHLRHRFGDFGSGYPSDQRTIEFLKKGLIPKRYIRSSWKTIKRINNNSLMDYL